MMLPVLGWLMRRQLIDEAGSRVRNARRAYVVELDDRIKTSKLAATLLADNQDIQRAIRDGDIAAAQAESAAFLKLYPDADIVLMKKDGTVVSMSAAIAMRSARRSIVAEALAGKPGEGLSGRGCGTSVHRRTSQRVRPTDGAVVVGFRFTEQRLESTGKKVGLELAMVDGKGEVVHKTAGFPKVASRSRSKSGG